MDTKCRVNGVILSNVGLVKKQKMEGNAGDFD
jgi:hypothetical protein